MTPYDFEQHRVKEVFERLHLPFGYSHVDGRYLYTTDIGRIAVVLTLKSNVPQKTVSPRNWYTDSLAVGPAGFTRGDPYFAAPTEQISLRCLEGILDILSTNRFQDEIFLPNTHVSMLTELKGLLL